MVGSVATILFCKHSMISCFTGRHSACFVVEMLGLNDKGRIQILYVTVLNEIAGGVLNKILDCYLLKMVTWQIGMQKTWRHSMLFSPSDFNTNDSPWAAVSSQLENHRNSGFPFMDPEIVRDRSYQLNAHKSMGPGGIHSRVLDKLGGVIAGPHLMIYQ